MTIQEEISKLHEEHNGIREREDRVKVGVSIQNAIGAVLAASIIGLASMVYGWQRELGQELEQMRDWQNKYAVFAEYGSKDVQSIISRLERLEGFANQGRRFTYEDGVEHEKRLRELESKFAVINTHLTEIIRRLDQVHQKSKVSPP